MSNLSKETIDRISGAKTASGDYTGKLICELPDVVVNSAESLKARFDAAVKEVLDPAHNKLCEATAEAVSEIDEKKSDIEHTHSLAGESITGVLPADKGGTGTGSLEALKAALGAIPDTNVLNAIADHNAAVDAHKSTIEAAVLAHANDLNAHSGEINTVMNNHKYDSTAHATAIAAAISSQAFLAAHPVGSLFVTSQNINPAEEYGGSWTRIKDKFILAAGDSFAAGTTGGAAAVTLAAENMATKIKIPYGVSASGNRTVISGQQVFLSGTASGYAAFENIDGTAGQAFNNMPPYTAKYVWERIA